jgi:hypothetical protein
MRGLISREIVAAVWVWVVMIHSSWSRGDFAARPPMSRPVAG